MRKFDKPFDSYELTLVPPISIEINPQGPSRYLPLLDNPIYYFHGFQYIRGGLYRAIFGYEEFWDTELEDKLTTSLSEHLRVLSEKNLYYLEDIEFLRDANLSFGVFWKRRVKPKAVFRHKRKFPVSKGERALARIDKLDPDNRRIDIEFNNGKIITVSQRDYDRMKVGFFPAIKVLNEVDRTKQKSSSKPKHTNQKDAELAKARSFARTSGKDPSEKVVTELLNLRKRLRRSNPMF